MPASERAAAGMNPLVALRQLTPTQAARYNGAALQRERILHRLRQGPATRPALERECSAPSVTKRISELRGAGWRIESQWVETVGPDGTLNETTLYSLPDADTSQRDLFELEPA